MTRTAPARGPGPSGSRSATTIRQGRSPPPRCPDPDRRTGVPISGPGAVAGGNAQLPSSGASVATEKRVRVIAVVAAGGRRWATSGPYGPCSGPGARTASGWCRIPSSGSAGFPGGPGTVVRRALRPPGPSARPADPPPQKGLAALAAAGAPGDGDRDDQHRVREGPGGTASDRRRCVGLRGRQGTRPARPGGWRAPAPLRTLRRRCRVPDGPLPRSSHPRRRAPPSPRPRGAGQRHRLGLGQAAARRDPPLGGPTGNGPGAANLLLEFMQSDTERHVRILRLVHADAHGDGVGLRGPAAPGPRRRPGRGVSSPLRPWVWPHGCEAE